MSKVSCEAARKHRRCDFANGATELLQYIGGAMVFTIDFNSDEAIYIQLCNQIITCIAMEEMRDGDILPSVRQLADVVGVNMHTVNKAYSVLMEEGFIKLDRRRGAVIALDADKLRAMQELTDDMRVIVAKALCKNLAPDEIHNLVDEIIAEYIGGGN